MNPLRNGVLMVSILLGCYLATGLYFVGTSRSAERRRTIQGLMLLTPTILLLSTFVAWPAISGLFVAFTGWEDGGSKDFTGLENFRRLFSDIFVWKGMGNLFVLTIAAMIKATVFPFLVALMLRSLAWPRAAYFLRTLFLVPMVTPAVTFILIWAFIYDPNIGMLNDLLNALGFEGRAWLGERHLALPSVIAIGFPWVAGLNLLIYLAGLLQIDPAIQEASRLDCPGVVHRIVYIDIPMVMPQTSLILVITLICVLQDFQTILLLTGGGPGLETSVPALQMYQRAFNYGQFGYGASIGLMLFVLVLGSTVIMRRLLRSDD